MFVPEMSTTMKYKLLDDSGLRISETALGTMTFGEDWGWVLERKKPESYTKQSEKLAAISLTLPTFIRMAAANPYLANSCRVTVKAWYWPRSTATPCLEATQCRRKSPQKHDAGS
jgi:hypothetical protein